MLTSVNDVKTLLGITDTSKDAILSLLVPAADAAVKEYCGRDFEQQSYTEYYSGRGTRYLPLRQRPVQSVASVYLDNTGYFGQNPAGAYAAATLLVAGQDYALVLDYTIPGTQTAVSRQGVIARIGTVWPEIDRNYSPGNISLEAGPSVGNIEVIYTAGYASPPYDAVEAVRQLAITMYRTRLYGDLYLQQESLGEYNYSLAQRTLQGALELGSTRQLLSRYREFAL